MADYIAPIKRLVEEYRRLPGVGAKTAVRYAFATLDLNEEEALAFADAIIGAKRDVTKCPICFSLCDAGAGCGVCSDENRDHSLICVVDSAKDIMVMERVRGYKGVYHVLGGVISPRSGKGVQDLNIMSLPERIKKLGAEEVMIATGATVEGETTAMYVSRVIKPTGVKITRLAYGIPVGADIEYADKLTLLRAIEGRRDF